MTRMLKKQIVNTVAEWRALLQYFPTDEVSGLIVMRLLERMVSTPEQLAWLSRAMTTEVGKWSSEKDLRGVFCSRYRPADGVSADCASGPFAPDHLATRSMMEAEEYKRIEAGDNPELKQLREMRKVKAIR